MAAEAKKEEIVETPSWNFAVVICRNKEGKYLAVNETRNRGLLCLLILFCNCYNAQQMIDE